MAAEAAREALALLSQTPEAHVSHLKMARLLGADVVYHIQQAGPDWALSMLVPLGAYSFDAAAYPRAGYIVYLAGGGPALARAVDALPRGRGLVFKLSTAAQQALVLARFPAVYACSYDTYALRGSDAPRGGDVLRERTLKETLLPLWMANGYDRPLIQRYFAEGAVAYSVWQDGAPLSTCLAFPSSEGVWEIGAVHTLPAARGRGLAGRCVRAAAFDLLAAGLLPVYQAARGNEPSIRLAESLGFTRIYTLQHFVLA